MVFILSASQLFNTWCPCKKSPNGTPKALDRTFAERLHCHRRAIVLPLFCNNSRRYWRQFLEPGALTPIRALTVERFFRDGLPSSLIKLWRLICVLFLHKLRRPFVVAWCWP